MLTRKYYKMLASIIADIKEDRDTQAYHAQYAIGLLVGELCKQLKTDNARFNAHTFLVDCGYIEGK
jgi:hypothetical protein